VNDRRALLTTGEGLSGRDRRSIPAEDVFAEYLLKPVMPEDLVAAVRRVLSS
jgi:hypothetical protein